MKTYIYFFIICVFSITLFPQEHYVDKSQNNLAKFISDAPVESFEGVTDQIDGFIYWEENELINKSQLYFEVNLDALDTGIGLRNRHMRENYLNTPVYPFAQFNGKIVSQEKLNDSRSNVVVEGEMFIHGKAHQQTITGIISKENGLYRIQSEFIVKLTDHNIPIPSLMFMRISEDMKVIVDFYVKEVNK